MDIQYLTVNHLFTKDLIRIFSKIEINPDISWNGTPCWIWRAHRNKNGYGTLCWAGTSHKAHRVMFAWIYHPLPYGRQNGEIDHLCYRPACCNPLHLEFVSSRVNIRRSKYRRTHCKYDHPLSGNNLRLTSKGVRRCLECHRRRSLLYAREHYSENKLRTREWRQNNRERFNEWQRKHYRQMRQPSTAT